jgi:hypothetical protein
MAEVQHQFEVYDSGKPHSLYAPEPCRLDGTNFPVYGYAFTRQASNFEQLSFRFRANNYGSGSVFVDVDWLLRGSQTTGTPTWGGSMAVVTPGDAQSALTDALQTEQTAGVATSTTANGYKRTTITLSNTDSMAADDLVELRLRRVDTSGPTDDAVAVFLTVRYSDS